MIDVFDIERFATHDGPGIRTAVFMKGCPLHCPWCSNPESQSTKPVLMHDNRKCVQCGRCMAVCPVHAIAAEPHFTVDTSKCTHCGICIDNCMHDAVHMAGRKMSSDEILQTIARDDDYYRESNGGVTISGGEPFLQHKALLSLLKKLKKKHYHTAVETTGFCDCAVFENTLPFIDLLLFDLKTLDGRKYASIGADMDIILHNLDIAMKHPETKIILRTPVIPGFNDDQKSLMNILKFARRNHIPEIHFLPYHVMGKVKYEQMGKPYAMPQKGIDPSSLNEYIKKAGQLGIHLIIGG